MYIVAYDTLTKNTADIQFPPCRQAGKRLSFPPTQNLKTVHPAVLHSKVRQTRTGSLYTCSTPVYIYTTHRTYL